MTSRDGRAIARENEIRMLRALHRFGWMRTRDLAVLVWVTWAKNPIGVPDLAPVAPTASALRMAQRTLRRMRDKRLVLSHKAPDGSSIYALAEGGVRALEQLGIVSGSGKDLVRNSSAAHYRHRCISSQIAIAAIVRGYRVSSEREIAQGAWLGGELGIAGKRPDVLIRSAETAWWVEVERSRKNATDYARLLVWLGKVLQDASKNAGSSLLGQFRWGQIVFVCRQAFDKKLRRDLIAAGWRNEQINQYVKFETSLYRLEDQLFGL